MDSLFLIFKKMKKTENKQHLLPSIVDFHLSLSNTKLRLSAEYNWDNEFVDSAIDEYYRFIQLHVTYPSETIVPGIVVDKVWHDHILHTKNYIKFCNDCFGEYMHHDPKDRSIQTPTDIQPTLDLYKQLFGRNAPKKFWTDPIQKSQLNTPNHSNYSDHSHSVGRHSCCRCAV